MSDTKTENDIITELVDDLTTELSAVDSEFSSTALTQKVKQALREVKLARKYPSAYTDTMIATDLEYYYSDIRNIALYDYNQIGAEFENNHSESNVKRDWVDRDKLFNGIYPLARF